MQGFHSQLKIQFACMHRYTSCTYISIVPLACDLPLVWVLPSFIHGWKKNPVGVLSLVNQSLPHKNTHTFRLLYSLCRDRLHCMATKQPSNTTSILPSLQYTAGLFPAPFLTRLCVPSEYSTPAPIYIPTGGKDPSFRKIYILKKKSKYWISFSHLWFMLTNYQAKSTF